MKFPDGASGEGGCGECRCVDGRCALDRHRRGLLWLVDVWNVLIGGVGVVDGIDTCIGWFASSHEYVHVFVEFNATRRFAE